MDKKDTGDGGRRKGVTTTDGNYGRMAAGRKLRGLEKWVDRADAVVRGAVGSFPPDLRSLAEGLPVFFELDVAPHWLRDGVEPDSLGLFSGPSLADPDETECIEAPAITLFIGNLLDFCRDEGLSFEEEVRVTYLHEFGHYLGLEEDDMESRGIL